MADINIQFSEVYARSYVALQGKTANTAGEFDVHGTDSTHTINQLALGQIRKWLPQTGPGQNPKTTDSEVKGGQNTMNFSGYPVAQIMMGLPLYRDPSDPLEKGTEELSQVINWVRDYNDKVWHPEMTVPAAKFDTDAAWYMPFDLPSAPNAAKANPGETPVGPRDIKKPSDYLSAGLNGIVGKLNQDPLYTTRSQSDWEQRNPNDPITSQLSLSNGVISGQANGPEVSPTTGGHGAEHGDGTTTTPPSTGGGSGGGGGGGGGGTAKPPGTTIPNPTSGKGCYVDASWDTPVTGEQIGLVKLREYILYVFNGKDDGIFADRPKRESSSASLHREGRAWDWVWPSLEVRDKVLKLLLEYAGPLNIQGIGDYTGAQWWSCVYGWRKMSGYGVPWLENLHIERNWTGAKDDRPIVEILALADQQNKRAPK